MCESCDGKSVSQRQAPAGRFAYDFFLQVGLSVFFAPGTQPNGQLVMERNFISASGPAFAFEMALHSRISFALHLKVPDVQD